MSVASVLSRIAGALNANPAIFHTVGYPVAEPNSEVCHWVEYFVAPKTGGLYCALELQEFMMSLLPNIDAYNNGHKFDQDSHGIDFGALRFDEQIGGQVLWCITTITDKDMPATGKKSFRSTRPAIRRIFVRPYPNAQIAKEASEGKRKQDYIKWGDLRKYREVETTS